MRGWPSRFAGIVSVFVLGMGIWLTLDASAQAPAKKPVRKEEVEENDPGKIKKKVPLRVEDEDEPRRAPGEKAAAPRPADLGVEGKKAEHAAVSELFLALAIPHDLLHRTSGRTMRIEPYHLRVTANTTKSEFRKICPQDEKGKAGPPFTIARVEVKEIQPYEEIALGLVKKFLDPKGPAKSLPRVEALRLAERALGAVARHFESTRTRGLREGDGWDDIDRQLRDELLRIQIDIVGVHADNKDWNQAYAAAARLVETNRKPEVHARIAQHLQRFLVQSLQEENYDEAKRRMRLMEDLFPNTALTGPVAEGLSRKAADLVQRAKSEKDPVKAMAILTTAESVWPRLPGLRNEILKRSKTYPILYVGVHDLPESLSPGAACTDSERQAVELLFESLMKAVIEPGLGQRYVPWLAEDRPRLIPLGREFVIAHDAYWSNGNPVMAVDVRATVNLLKGKQGMNLIEEARIGGDPHRIAITLRQGYLDPLSLMTFKIVPESAHLERADDARFAKQPIGSGPFMLGPALTAEKKSAEPVRFVANHNYRRAGKAGLPRIREVVFYKSKDPAGDFASGRLDLLLDPEAVGRVRSVPRVSVHTLPNRRIYFLAVNHRRPVLQSTELRRAIALAIDRTKILDDVFRPDFKGESPLPHRALKGPFPCGTWACKPEPKHELCDIDVAKVLADKAKGAKLTLKFPSNDARVAQACEAIRDQVKAVGIQLQLEPRTPAQLRRDVEHDHEYDLAYYQHDFDSDAYLLWPLFDPDATGADGRNYLGYQDDKELQSHLRKTLLHRDIDEVRKLAHTTHLLFCEKMPLIPLWQLDTLLAIHADLKTAPAPAQLDPLRIFTDVERWELTRGQ